MIFDKILKEAEERAEKAFEAKRAKALQDYNAWRLERRKRYQANNLVGQLSHVNGRIEEDYMIDEVPFDIGYNLYPDESYSIEWIAIGGMDIMHLLPPNVLNVINSHIEELVEREISRG